jgi:CTP:molybdopterin cytidylyltransferase MocA/SAM-dependent methyltransferase
MLAHVLDRVAQAGIDDVVVVLGDDAATVEAELEWRTERRVQNPDPGRGLSSSLRTGLAAIPAATDAALILLGDQPFVSAATIRAIIEEGSRTDRPIVAPRYASDGGRNPVLLKRSVFTLADGTHGDRGLGPLLAANPGLVGEVAVPGENPDIDTRADLARVLEELWADRVRANAAQVDRFREVPDGADFYAPVRSLFRADPRRTDDPVLNALLALIEPGETWLDVGAGAGRFALPIALALQPSGGRVIAIDVSPSMLEALREIAGEHQIENIETIEGRWPLPEGTGTPSGDVALIAHVGYDIEGIGPFIAALEALARRLCVAVLMDRAPASASDPFWPMVHGEARVPLPGLPELVELLRARGRDPQVSRVVQEARSFESKEQLGGFARRQLWIDPDGPKEAAFQAAVNELVLPDARGGWTLRDRPSNDIGVLTWKPG